MIVDDEEFCIAAMESMLKMFGINKNHIDFCFNGREAMNTFKEAHSQGFTYSIIFMDFNMPIMDGIIAT